MSSADDLLPDYSADKWHTKDPYATKKPTKPAPPASNPYRHKETKTSWPGIVGVIILILLLIAWLS
jgi:hypothetical protein